MHPALAAHGAAGEVDPREPMHEHAGGFDLSLGWWWLAEQVTTLGQRASTRAVREETEVANPHETSRHDVEEKTSEEFGRLERHDLHAVVIGIVPPPESDTAVAVIHEAIIRERDTMRVPPEVVEHLLGAGEGPLGIHHPWRGTELGHEGGETPRVGERRGAGGEGESPVVEGASQAGEIFGSEDGRERLHRK